MPSLSGPREGYPSQGTPGAYPIRSTPMDRLLDPSLSYPERRPSTGDSNFGRMGSSSNALLDNSQIESDARLRSSPEHYPWEDESPSSWTDPDFLGEGSKTLPSGQRIPGKAHSQRRPSNRDEFDGPHQLLERPPADVIAAQERNLPHLPTNLFVNEQDEILSQVNDRLSQCAFDFIAKYQFPIPLEPDKRPVRVPADREWTEWVYLLKRLATKRRVPARVLYNNQIKQLVTVLENSLEMRHAAKHQSRPLKDDRNVLQLISAGLQVAKILKDASCMEFLDSLYVQTERTIQNRRNTSGFIA